MRSHRLLPALIGLAALVALPVVTVGSADASTIWHATRAIAERDVADRFANVDSVRCNPDRTSSSFVKGRTRLWNRFACEGTTFDSVAFSLIYRATGECKPCWRMSGLEGTGAAHLRSQPASSPPPAEPSTPPPPPAPAVATRTAKPAEPVARCRATYRRAGQRIRYRAGVDSGEFLLLKDGSIWQTTSSMRSKTERWNRFHTVVLVDGDFGFQCTMVNLNRGERVPVRQALAGACGGAVYANAGKRVAYESRRNRGEVVVLEDGSEWEVAESLRSKTARWRAREDDVIVFPGDGRWPHMCALINLDRAEVVDARLLG